MNDTHAAHFEPQRSLAMTAILRVRVILAAWSLVASAFVAHSAAAQVIGYDEFGPWIAAHHPNVQAGDRRVNAVLLVVDANGQYVASVADSLPFAVIAAIDSGFSSVGAHNAVEDMARELVADRLRVPGMGAHQPLYIVDGVRVGRVDSLSANEIENIQLLKGDEAVSKYGPGAADGGAIVVTVAHSESWSRVVTSSNRERLSRLGIDPERVDMGDTQMMHVRAGIVGPYPMYITVLRLKKTP
jgi:hypothetical protein